MSPVHAPTNAAQNRGPMLKTAKSDFASENVLALYATSVMRLCVDPFNTVVDRLCMPCTRTRFRQCFSILELFDLGPRLAARIHYREK